MFGYICFSIIDQGIIFTQQWGNKKCTINIELKFAKKKQKSNEECAFVLPNFDSVLLFIRQL